MTPGQFSAAVALVVLLVGAGFIAGYIWGMKSLRDGPDAVHVTESVTGTAGKDIQTGIGYPTKPDRAPTITFYSELTEDRVEDSPVRNPQKKKEVVSKPTLKEVSSRSEEKTTEIPSTGAVVGKGTMIQVGSYREEDKAVGFLKGLSDSGYQGVLIRVDLGPRGVWFRVRLGPYPSESHAQKVLAKLQDEASIKGFVVR
jgi:cell division septation protein DedD